MFTVFMAEQCTVKKGCTFNERSRVTSKTVQMIMEILRITQVCACTVKCIKLEQKRTFFFKSYF